MPTEGEGATPGTQATGDATGENAQTQTGGNTDQAQAGAAAASGATPPPSVETTELPPEVKALLSKLRKDVDAKDREAKALQTRVQAFEDAQKTEEQRQAEALQAAQAQVTELQAKLQSAALTHTIARAAIAMNLVDVDAAVALLSTIGAVEYDGAGQPTNVQTLLDELVKAKPYLVKAAPAAATAQTGSTTNPAAGRNAGDVTMEWIKSASQEQIAENLPKVQEFLAKHKQ